MQEKVKHITHEQRMEILNRMISGFWYDVTEVKPNIAIMMILLIMSETGLRLRKVLGMKKQPHMAFYNEEKEKYYLLLNDQEIPSSKSCNEYLDWYLRKFYFPDGYTLFKVSEQYVARYLQKACYELGAAYYGITPSSFWMFAREKQKK